MTLAELNKSCNHTLVDLLGIEFIKNSSGALMASMLVSEYHKQPFGYLHGGASIALAESLASASSLWKLNGKAGVMATQVSTNHLLSIQDGIVVASGELVFESKKIHIWDIEVRNQEGLLLSVSRITNRIILADNE